MGKHNNWLTPVSDYIDGVRVVRKAYTQWSGMVARAGKNKYYKKVVVSDLFKNYDQWYDWANNQKGFLNLEPSGRIWSIDKDIIGDGSIYSEDVCVFVPAEINNLVKGNGGIKNKCISKLEPKKGGADYTINIGYKGQNICLGVYYSEERALLVYNKFKKVMLDDLYLEYKDSVDHRVFEYLHKSCDEDILRILNK